jgi:hypothetical protein
MMANIAPYLAAHRPAGPPVGGFSTPLPGQSTIGLRQVTQTAPIAVPLGLRSESNTIKNFKLPKNIRNSHLFSLTFIE